MSYQQDVAQALHNRLTTKEEKTLEGIQGVLAGHRMGVHTTDPKTEGLYLVIEALLKLLSLQEKRWEEQIAVLADAIREKGISIEHNEALDHHISSDCALARLIREEVVRVITNISPMKESGLSKELSPYSNQPATPALPEPWPETYADAVDRVEKERRRWPYRGG